MTGRHAGGVHVLVMAKAPVPGRVKTRLCPPCTEVEAAEVALAALADTLEAVAGCGADHKIVALDGPVGEWLPAGFGVVPQRGRALDERLAAAWAATRPLTGGWGIQIGMDTPQVTAENLDRLLELLTSRPPACEPGTALLGPADDGGWWVIGLPGSDPSPVFRGVPMSSRSTGARQAARLRSLGLGVRLVESRRDIDLIDDLRAVAATIPSSRTASVARRLLPELVVAGGRPG